MSYLDASHDVERAFAIRARVARAYVADVRDVRLRQIAAPVDASQVVALFVCAADEVGHGGDRAVGDHAHLGADRPDVAGRRMEVLADLGVGCEAEGADRLLRLDLVQIVVAAQEQQKEIAIVHHRHRLHGATERQAKELGDRFAFGLAGRRQLAHRFLRRRPRPGRERLCELDVGGVVRLRAEGDRVLAGVREHMEFVRAGAADRPGVGRHRPEPEPDAGKDARIRVVHVAVFALEVGEIGVKRIAVLHDEFAPAHDAEAGPALIAEFALDLVEVCRQPPVALQLAARELRDHLFRRRLDDEVPLMTILKAQQLRTVLLPAARFLPELRRLHDRHRQFHRAGAVHLLAHDRFHLAQHAQAERQPGVDAGGEPADEARAQHQPVARDLGLGGHFLLRRDEKLGSFHAPATALSMPAGCGKIKTRILLRLP